LSDSRCPISSILGPLFPVADRARAVFGSTRFLVSSAFPCALEKIIEKLHITINVSKDQRKYPSRRKVDGFDQKKTYVRYTHQDGTGDTSAADPERRQ